MRYSNPALLEHLASSYVLGTLSSGANRRFEKLLHDRADVRVLVAQWQARLGQLAVSVPVQQPSKKLWAAIAVRTQPTAIRQPSTWTNWLRPAGFGLGGLAAGVLAASAVFFTAPALFMTADQIAMRTGEKLPQSYVGLLTDAAGNGKVLASSLRHGKTMSIKVIGPFTPPAAGRLVLWAVPASGPAFAIGTVPATGTAVAMLPDTSEKLLSKVSKLIVTVELDAAPLAPSDQVFFRGNCAKLW
jgi:anti-sigma-K factor RskA